MPLKVQLCTAFFFKKKTNIQAYFYFACYHHLGLTAYGILVPQSGIEPVLPCVGGAELAADHQGSPCVETISRMYSPSAPGLSPPATRGLWAGSRFPHLPRDPTASCRTWRTGSSTHTCQVHQPANWHSEASTDAPPRSSEPVAQVMLRPDSRPGLPTNPSQLLSHRLIP